MAPVKISPLGRNKSDLSPAHRWLMEVIQNLHFGRLERLTVRSGAPAFEPATRVVRTLKIGGRNDPRPQVSAADFVLKKEFVELFEQLMALGDATVARIDVAHGLPFVVEVEESLN